MKQGLEKLYKAYDALDEAQKLADRVKYILMNSGHVLSGDSRDALDDVVYALNVPIEEIYNMIRYEEMQQLLKEQKKKNSNTEK